MTSQARDSIAPVLPVSDVRKASEMLRDKLGFCIVEPCGGGRDWAVVRREASAIVLVPSDWPAGCEIHVNDVDGVFAALSALGAEFASPPMNQEYGQRDFAVRGPDGYQIRFFGPTAR